MANPKPGWMQGLDQDQVDFYLGLSAAATVCRGRRRHDFHMDDMLPGKPLPKGIAVTPSGRSGIVQMRDHCKRKCGRWIEYLTDSKGYIDWTTAKYGTDPDKRGEYHANGLGLTAADDRMFFTHQMAETVKEATALAVKRSQAEQVEEALVS